MRTLGQLRTITLRELQSIFLSPMGYLVAVSFLLINGITALTYLAQFQGDLEMLLIFQFTGIPFWFLTLLIPPLLTMRSFAEERRSGTFELLASAGVPDAVLVGAKFLAAWAFFVLLWLSALPLFVLLDAHAQVDWGAVLGVHLGLVLVGGLFTALGILTSTLTQNQLVAACLATVSNLLVFFVSSLRLLFTPGDFEIQYFNYVSLAHHFGSDFSRGVFDLRTLVFYPSCMLFFLFLAVKVLERRRWW